MDDDVINIRRISSSLNLHECKTEKCSQPNTEVNIKLLKYHDLFDHIMLLANFNGTHYVFEYKNKNNLKVSLYMRNLKSIADYIFKNHNETDIKNTK